MHSLLKEYAQHVVESIRMREADISDDKRVPWGSPEHIKDLETRIENFKKWRNKHKRGSDARANYTRLISQLKSELRSASRQSSSES